MQRVLTTLLWTVGLLAVIDMAVGWTFQLPVDPRQKPSMMQRYFDYGRSIEGKLRHQTGPTPDRDAPMLQAGWLTKECGGEAATPAGQFGVDLYGMSFSSKIAAEMTKLDPGVTVHSFAGPGASPNFSFACFQHRRATGRELAPVQIFSVLASSLPRLQTVSGLTTSFEEPAPFTYPRYRVGAGGRLLETAPGVQTADEFHAILADPVRWQAYLDHLAAQDAFYQPWLIRADIFDHSVIGRMIRRAWGQQHKRALVAALRADEGFAGAPEIPQVLGAILRDFAANARKAGARPVVLLIEDQGIGTALSKVAGPMLAADGIEFLATSTIASPRDTQNFITDGHFTAPVSVKIARALLTMLGRMTQVSLKP